MKLEQAIKALRRGEKVRRKVWEKGRYLVADGLRICDNGLKTDGPMRDILENDWVIFRKKKKALRDVWADPRVGDKVQRRSCAVDTVEVVTDKLVAMTDTDDGCFACSLISWRAKGSSGGWTVISRAEG